MANIKLSNLTALGSGLAAAGDLLCVVDVSDTTQAASGTTKKITLTNLFANIPVAASFASTLGVTGAVTLGASLNGGTATELDINSTPGSATKLRLQRSGGTGGVDIHAGNTTTVNASFSDGGGLTMRADIFAGAATEIGWTGRATAKSPSDGVVTLYNDALNDFSRLQFGGTTSSFPALKRSSATLLVRLADDSADANIQGAVVIGSTGGAFGSTPATTGVVRIPSNSPIYARNAGNTDNIAVLTLTASPTNVVYLAPGGGTGIGWGTAAINLGGGAAATLGTIGGSGPAAAAQRKWLQVYEDDGTASFIPVWR